MDQPVKVNHKNNKKNNDYFVLYVTTIVAIYFNIEDTSLLLYQETQYHLIL